MGATTRVSRLRLLAVGLGVGGTVGFWPGIASADDFQISIDGFDLFSTAGNSASASSGMGDIAIAFGPNSNAVADGGFGDVADAFSTGSSGVRAIAGDESAGATGNNFDVASAFGNDGAAVAGAGFNSPFFNVPDTTGSSFDYASDVGNDNDVLAGYNGSGDFASGVGDKLQSFAGFSSDAAAPANFDSASVLGNLDTPTTGAAVAGGGDMGFGGSNDLAFVLDPFGTVGSTAVAGLGHSFDLAAALADDVNAMASGADYLLSILPSL
jgi:hypothetical protein